jgi:alcohol dehydrogenase class IV
MRQEVLFGFGSRYRLARVIARRASRRVFLVTGRTSFDRSGAAGPVETALERCELVRRFADFTENPKLPDAIGGVDAFRSAGPDLVVAVGGGSAIDMAKLVVALAAHGGDPMDIVTGRQPVAGQRVPIVAMPTTAGSGTEATQFAVVYVGHEKYSVSAPALRPDVAIVDPALTCSLSPALTAISGMDAFSQAVESYWSVRSTDASKRCAARAIALVLEHLPTSVHAPTRHSRRAMSKAAHLAGCAINITRTTGAHAMSYALTSHFGIPHGHAVCLSLGQWLLFNSAVTDADVIDPRGAAYVRQTIAELSAMMGCHDPVDCCRRIEDLTRTVGLSTRLGSLGVSTSDALRAVVPNVNAERAANNPRALTTTSLERLVEAVC